MHQAVLSANHVSQRAVDRQTGPQSQVPVRRTDRDHVLNGVRETQTTAGTGTQRRKFLRGAAPEQGLKQSILRDDLEGQSHLT